MYNLFVTHSDILNVGLEKDISLISNLDKDVVDFFKECSGLSFDRGLYKTHTPNSSLHWSVLIGNYFANFGNKLIPFGYDWMGRQFCIINGKNNYILMLDPATGEYFELNESIGDFHNHDLIHEKEDVLSQALFNSVLEYLKIAQIDYSKCIGYKVPLFLNGTDDLNNYEIIDMEVYCEFERQIYEQIKALPPGTKIDSITFAKS